MDFLKDGGGEGILLLPTAAMPSPVDVLPAMEHDRRLAFAMRDGAFIIELDGSIDHPSSNNPTGLSSAVISLRKGLPFIRCGLLAMLLWNPYLSVYRLPQLSALPCQPLVVARSVHTPAPYCW
jgi:hypothetical protein